MLSDFKGSTNFWNGSKNLDDCWVMYNISLTELTEELIFIGILEHAVLCMF